MVILTHLEKDDMEVKYATNTKETMKPSFLEKKMSGLCFLRRAGRYFSLHLESNLFHSSVRQNQCACGRLMTYSKKRAEEDSITSR